MKKKIAVVSLGALLAAGPAFASGYRIPEQSLNSVALSNAYVASTPSADASYYNPANMSWLEGGWQAEASLTWIHLTRVDYTTNDIPARSGSSRSEDFALPNLHLVSPAYNNFRFGLSVVYPYGLSKRWDSPYARTFAEEFTLKTYELNPTVSYRVNDTLSIGGGIRAVHSEGKVKSNGTVVAMDLGGGNYVYSNISRDLEGDTTAYGYNLALTWKPVENLALAATYRSKIDLDIEGDATLASSQGFLGDGTPFPALTAGSYGGAAAVSVPAPAVLSLATSYTCNNGRTTAEFVYDKTFWSAYDNLDFNYATPLHPVLTAAFDNPKAKNWSNAEAFRFGLSHRCTERFTAMLGFAIDKNPVPDSTLGFDLPDSDARIYSLGMRYRLQESLEVGAAYLLSDKKRRTVSNGTVDGTFDNAAAHLFNVGLQYRF